MNARLDKKLLKSEITKLEKAMMVINCNLVLACSSSNNHFEIHNKVWDTLKIELNSTGVQPTNALPIQYPLTQLAL